MSGWTTGDVRGELSRTGWHVKAMSTPWITAWAAFGEAYWAKTFAFAAFEYVKAAHWQRREDQAYELLKKVCTE